MYEQFREEFFRLIDLILSQGASDTKQAGDVSKLRLLESLSRFRRTSASSSGTGQGCLLYTSPSPRDRS